MNYAELFRALETLLPRESWCIDVETWRHGYEVAVRPVRVTWKVWLGEDVCGVEAASAEAVLEAVRSTVAARPPKPVPTPAPAPDVQAIGEIPSPPVADPVSF